MQLHQYDDIGAGDECSTLSHHPACHPRRKVDAVVELATTAYAASDT